jgi:hypothetical protein
MLRICLKPNNQAIEPSNKCRRKHSIIMDQIKDSQRKQDFTSRSIKNYKVKMNFYNNVKNIRDNKNIKYRG